MIVFITYTGDVQVLRALECLLSEAPVRSTKPFSKLVERVFAFSKVPLQSIPRFLAPDTPHSSE
jgi:hypothetical protein